MRLKTIAGTALAIALAWAAPSQAAKITVERDGCNPKGCYAIHIDGDIVLEDMKRFDDIVQQNNIRNAVVYLNSDGGLMIPGLMIGLSIYEHNFYTFVPDDAYCVSMCAAMWVAGNKKYVAPTAKVGFHQPYLKDRRGRIYADPKAVALMRSYYLKVGVPKPAADFFVSADPQDVYWLNEDLASGFHIEVSTWTTKEEEKKKDQSKVQEEKTVTLPKAFIDELAKKGSL